MTISTISKTVPAYTGGIPNRGDIANFETDVDTSLTYQANLPTDLNELTTQVNTAIGQMNTDIAQVNTDATTASDAATLAAGTANLVGDWSSLTGTLNQPASVYHAGAIWILLTDLADVTLSEPSEANSDWLLFTSTEAWVDISTSQTLATKRRYAVDFTSGLLTLTLPLTPVKDDFVELYRSAGTAVDSVIARNGETIMGLAEDLTIDVEITSLKLVFNGTDWRIV